MKKLSTLMVAMFMASAILPGLRAQITHNGNVSTDKTAAELLKKAESKLQNVSLTVTMTALDGQKKQLSKQTANVKYSKGRYHMVSADQELICDGTTVWHWDKQAREVTVSNIPSDDDINLLNPSKVLASYERNFRAKYIRTESNGTAVVDLQPRSARSFHKLRLMIDEKSGTLKSLEVHKYDSSREIYVFTKHSYASVRDSFRFDAKAHPDVEVIDMR